VVFSSFLSWYRPAVHFVWQDVRELPEALQGTLDGATGFAEVVELLTSPDVRRVVATGNGAAFYVAHALWLASLVSSSGPPVVAVPAGLIAGDRFSWRPGDVLFAISSSGEQRDIVEPLRAAAVPTPYAAVSSTPDSTIASGAAACALVQVKQQRAATHTQAYCGNLAATLAIWAEVTGDASLRRSVTELPSRCAAVIATVEDEATTQLPFAPRAAIAFGAGAAWAAALETALLLKEIAQLPCEGQEAREGATSGMTGLSEDCIAISIRTGNLLEEEAERLCEERGARVVAIDGGDDARVSPILSFPAAVRLAATLGDLAGVEVDNPPWTAAYYRTARSADGATHRP
jgi:fructoselysine-6-P-deglycase FrlB-like protein